MNDSEVVPGNANRHHAVTLMRYLLGVAQGTTLEQVPDQVAKLQSTLEEAIYSPACSISESRLEDIEREICLLLNGAILPNGASASQASFATVRSEAIATLKKLAEIHYKSEHTIHNLRVHWAHPSEGRLVYRLQARIAKTIADSYADELCSCISAHNYVKAAALIGFLERLIPRLTDMHILRHLSICTSPPREEQLQAYRRAAVAFRQPRTPLH